MGTKRIIFVLLLLISLAVNLYLVVRITPVKMGGGIDVDEYSTDHQAQVTALEERNPLHVDRNADFIRIQLKTGKRTREFLLRVKPKGYFDLSRIRDDPEAVMWKDGKLFVRIGNSMLELSPEPEVQRD